MVKDLLLPYGEDYTDIAVRYFVDGESPISIAANLNVSNAVVWKKLRKIKEIVRNVEYSYFT